MMDLCQNRLTVCERLEFCFLTMFCSLKGRVYVHTCRYLVIKLLLYKINLKYLEQRRQLMELIGGNSGPS